jgi:hypothetical protein
MMIRYDDHIDDHIWWSYMMIIYVENIDEHFDEHFENWLCFRIVWGSSGYVLASLLVPQKLSRPSDDHSVFEKKEEYVWRDAKSFQYHFPLFKLLKSIMCSRVVHFFIFPFCHIFRGIIGCRGGIIGCRGGILGCRGDITGLHPWKCVQSHVGPSDSNLLLGQSIMPQKTVSYASENCSFLILLADYASNKYRKNAKTL